MHTQLLGIDWGTSNRRAYLVGRDGKCLARHADDQGMLAVGGDFAGSLAALRASMGVSDAIPVVMSGMVGSASGWQEVPYLDTSVPLTALPAHLVPVTGQAGCFIVPGYCTRDGAVDVMRGEETQLLGAVGCGLGDGWVVLPGTHSKWVYLRGGRIDQLVTYMTGELFAMLAGASTLAALMADGPDDDTAFAAGLQEARRGRPLSNALFGVRARVVSKTMAAAQARSFVSGLLIGTEFVAAQGHADSAIDIIASSALSARYQSAAAHYGMPARARDPDEVYLAALAHFFERL
ncbi:2-dehydro-3-deoxygalactonokinase [Massilia antarctica]|uniref:2-dehydro-3-deoxygalactonokinase n=1 Tax=Massilia antarctica TaxID=2765360 RepID=UPI0006BB7B43|nr:2-dehydro-3-deoxygalactonokinase [Massilia sp. H27-R4]MCY0910478.1 2-dehydro-3-deoxygalactonokinase [Massilia sp. H27-R4]CUI09168.1 2-dehydro-3-deoxygalactonokinase [Janthinobacterium sp. CG23_2]CUU32954.1 2-dehydro-3-deoxygalactonokinase [Janthinobacterium sp. CG23_2]